MKTAHAAMAIALAVMLVGGCTRVDGPARQAAQKKYSAQRAEALWEQVERARRFSFDSREREKESFIWRRSYEREALLKIIEECPGDIDEARARLRLARLIRVESNRARHHVVLAQGILTELMERAPDTPQLMPAVVRATHHAAGFPDRKTAYYQRARRFLEARWNAGGEDAAEAGYHLAELMVSRARTRQESEQFQQHQQVAKKYPKSRWGQASRLRVIELRWVDTRAASCLEELIQFADTCPERSLAGEALFEAGAYWAEGTSDRRRDVPLERLQKARELYVRLSQQYPNWPQEWEEYQEDEQTRFWADHFAPRFPVSGELSGSQVVEVEKPAAPEVTEAVLAARVYYHLDESWGQEALAAAEEDLGRLTREYPGGRRVPSALDAVALRSLRNKHRQRASQLWKQLLEKYADHPLARIVALDHAYLEHLDSIGSQDDKHPETNWRATMGQIIDRYPDDVVLRVVGHSLRAQSFSHAGRYEEAVDELNKALPDWAAVAPDVGAGRVIGPHVITIDVVGNLAAGRMNLTPGQKYVKDSELYTERKPQTRAEQILFRQEVLERCPDSPRAANYLFELCQLLAAEKRYDEARASFNKYIQQYPSHAAIVLAARVWLIKLDYLQLGQAAKPRSRAETVRQLQAMLEKYDKGIQRIKPNDALGRKVMTVFGPEWPKLIAEQLRDAGYPKQPDKWFFLDGDGRIAVDLFDGEEREVFVLPTYRNALPIRGITYLIPYLSEALGLGEEGASRFVQEVVREVLLLDNAGNLLELPLPLSYSYISFYNQERTRLRTHRAWPPRPPDPSDDIEPPPVLLERVGQRWVPSDGDGWFLWTRGP